MISWDTSQAVTIALDRRLGRIKGRLVPPASGELPARFPLELHRSAQSAPGSFEIVGFWDARANPDGTFQTDGLPPGRYVVTAYFDQDGFIATKTETDVEVGPGAVAPLEIPVQRIPTITGRVVDGRTGQGIAGVGLASLCFQESMHANLSIGEATTDADGRYRIPARPGKMIIQLREIPKAYMGLAQGDYPRLAVQADQAWPDLKLMPAGGLDGLVVDGSGRPAAGAEVYLLVADRPGTRWRGEPVRTDSAGTFHLDRIDPDAHLSLWARLGDATTDGTVTVRPREIKGKLRLAVDPKFAARIRGLATDAAGRRVAGATVTLRWMRPYPADNARGKGQSWLGTPLDDAITRADGWFVFRGLWTGLDYDIAVEARGYRKAVAPEVTLKAGETHDVGKLVLLNIAGHVAGRVVGSDG